ncbi:MAG: metal ABC transporter substrate-binding protein [Pirellulaceae bacterium]
MKTTTKKTTAARDRWFVIAAILCLAPGCNSGDGPIQSKSWSTGKPVVAVTNYPLKYFVDQIGGGQVEVLFPVDADIDPAFWQPSAEAIGQLQQADLVLLNGADFETWLTGVTLSQSKLADTTREVSDQLIELEDGVVHQHGPEGEHSHSGYANTTWLDPQIAVGQARAARDELAKLAPEHKTEFDSRFAELEKQLREIDGQLTQLAQLLGQQHIIGSHPVYQYLARRMNLNMDSVHFEPGEEPTIEQWKVFDELAAANETKLMLWEGEPVEATRQQLADREITVVVFEPMGNQPAGGDYVTGMLANIERLKSAAQ